MRYKSGPRPFRRPPIAAQPWLDHYDPGVPASLSPYPGRLVFDFITDAAALRPTHPALLFKGARVSCAELDRLTDAFAAALVAQGIRKGDRIALLLPNTPQFIIAEVGAWKAGAIVLPLNPTYTARELEAPLAETGAETIVVLTPFYDRVKSCQPRTHLRRIIATGVKEFLPPLLRVLFTILKERREGHRIVLQPGDMWLSDLLSAHAGSPRPMTVILPEDTAVILLSGGTTGTPKGVLGNHRALVAAGLQLHAWTSGARVDWDDVIMLPLPLFHVYANLGVQSLAFVGHNPLALVPNPRDTADMLHSIRKFRPAFLAGVPALFIAMLNHPTVRAGKVSFSSIKLCFSGAAPLMADTRRRFEELTGGRIIEGYSLTEAMMACTVNPVGGVAKPGSVGMPLPDVEVAIVNADDGDIPMPAGGVGEILIRAPQVMSSYWHNAHETMAALRRHGDGGPWLHTGDLGYLDEDGYLYIVDRLKDLIKTSGYQVWPREIEEVLAAHPAVAEAGVAGVPDEAKGEAVKAWVVLRSGMPASEGDLRAHCRAHMAPYKVPSQFEFRSALPKTMIGKVLRRALVAEEARFGRG